MTELIRGVFIGIAVGFAVGMMLGCLLTIWARPSPRTINIVRR